jgi:transcriptional regulator with XRE-family HTH domain
VSKAELYQRLGENIRQARVARGLRQIQLADRCDLSRTSLTNIELGRQGVLVDQLVRIATELGTSLDDLVRHEGSSAAGKPPVSEELSEWLQTLQDRGR